MQRGSNPVVSCAACSWYYSFTGHDKYRFEFGWPLRCNCGQSIGMEFKEGASFLCPWKDFFVPRWPCPFGGCRCLLALYETVQRHYYFLILRGFQFEPSSKRSRYFTSGIFNYSTQGIVWRENVTDFW